MKPLYIKNGGVGSVTYSASSTQSWISISPNSGSASNQTNTMNVTINRIGLSAGNYSGTIVFNSNSNSVIINVSASVIPPNKPSVLCYPAYDITLTTAIIAGNLTSLGSSAVTQRGHCWSTSSNPTIVNNKSTLGGTNLTGNFITNMTGLLSNTTYFVRAYAINDLGESYSDQVTFTTLKQPTLAVVTTSAATNISGLAASISGNVADLGDGLLIQHGHCWSKNQNPTTNDFKTELGSKNTIGNFSSSLTNLSPESVYYVRAYAVNSIGTTYSSQVSFLTGIAPPVVMGGRHACPAHNMQLIVH